jgi:lysophospholipase L1-like esterase
VTQIKFVAIGDSFTEGVGDVRADGTLRGWADLTAEGLARSVGAPIQYANLAIRGRLLGPIIAGQLEPALALSPTIVTFNGGGNDMLRPGMKLDAIIAQSERALTQILESGAQPLLVFGADPTVGLPGGGGVRAKGAALAERAQASAERLGIRVANNWSDEELARPQYWSLDRLHLAPVGHHRVAANVLRTLGHEPPAEWVLTQGPMPAPRRRDQLRYAREHVMPWVGRRLTGRSSGDGRSAKYPDWVKISP